MYFWSLGKNLRTGWKRSGAEPDTSTENSQKLATVGASILRSEHSDKAFEQGCPTIEIHQSCLKCRFLLFSPEVWCCHHLLLSIGQIPRVFPNLSRACMAHFHIFSLRFLWIQGLGCERVADVFPKTHKGLNIDHIDHIGPVGPSAFLFGPCQGFADWPDWHHHKTPEDMGVIETYGMSSGQLLHWDSFLFLVSCFQEYVWINLSYVHTFCKDSRMVALVALALWMSGLES